jgi:hypothetical protein
MDSGLGSIFGKLFKQVRRIAIGFFRRQLDHPGETVLCLLLTIFYILGFHFQANEVGKFTFEDERFSFFAGCCFFATPGLLLINIFLCKQAWEIAASAIAAGILSAYLLLVLIGFAFSDDHTLIHRSTAPDGQLTALYRKAEFSGPGSTQHCQYTMTQRRIFPGILKNESVGACK